MTSWASTEEGGRSDRDEEVGPTYASKGEGAMRGGWER